MMISGQCPKCQAPWMKNNRPNFSGSSDACPKCGEHGWPSLTRVLFPIGNMTGKQKEHFDRLLEKSFQDTLAHAGPPRPVSR